MKSKNFTLSIKSLSVIFILLFLIAIAVQYYVLQQSKLRLAKSLAVFYNQVQNENMKDFGGSIDLDFKDEMTGFLIKIPLKNGGKQ